ncbi:uncharacterized protein BJ171DRAFT_144248 [Polychytrium aggregatum]|uniref:uncharacterized protein n=1 Tax=Polychytrium aggregatum TaxID=110093 RepID=UPI0022FEDB15|nr:uncharacterized protein BJ171DRAFT_144248 [Polychytrium aggregatum]KAI9203459.1 hypothetical protein BJ171DRAFT_144248 [Polychytrium aggregatum]
MPLWGRGGALASLDCMEGQRATAYPALLGSSWTCSARRSGRLFHLQILDLLHFSLFGFPCPLCAFALSMPLLFASDRESMAVPSPPSLPFLLLHLQHQPGAADYSFLTCPLLPIELSHFLFPITLPCRLDRTASVSYSERASFWIPTTTLPQPALSFYLSSGGGGLSVRQMVAFPEEYKS